MVKDIVFIHGDLQNHTVFNEARKFFEAKGHRVFLFDLPGHGEEKEIVEIMKFLNNKITCTLPIIVAHSSGAMMALKYLEETGNASALILISPLLISPLRILGNDVESIKKYYRDVSRSKFLRQELIDYSCKGEADLREIGFASTSFDGLENNFDFCSRVNLDFNFNVPTLFIAPEMDDVISFELYREMARKITNIRFEKIRSGHNPLITNPLEVNLLIARNYGFVTE